MKDRLLLLLARRVVRFMSDQGLAQVKGRLDQALSRTAAPPRERRIAERVHSLFASEIRRRANR